MKKMILPLLIFLMAIIGVSNGDGFTGQEEEGSAVRMKCTVSLLPFEGELIEPAPVPIPVEVEYLHRDEIPLTYAEQERLQAACEEFSVPYALALGLIEKETMFQNIVGDGGASGGYMQIQEKWHAGRMERLGVTDLLDPGGNFRVGCDFLHELYAKYNDWSLALTVYNMGRDPGYISDYAKGVMANYARWQKVIGNYI